MPSQNLMTKARPSCVDQREVGGERRAAV